MFWIVGHPSPYRPKVRNPAGQMQMTQVEPTYDLLEMVWSRRTGTPIDH